MRNTSQRIAKDENMNSVCWHLNCGDRQAVHGHNRGETGIDTEKGGEFQIQPATNWQRIQLVLISSVYHDNVVATEALQDQEQMSRKTISSDPFYSDPTYLKVHTP